MTKEKFKIIIISFLITLGIYDKETEIILFWKKIFLPNWEILTYSMSELDILRKYIWTESLPIAFICIFIYNLLESFTIKDKEIDDYSKCQNFKEFINSYNKTKNKIRANLLVNSTLILIDQIYKQVKYSYGFPYSYGALFIWLPLIYIFSDFCYQLILWKKQKNNRENTSNL